MSKATLRIGVSGHQQIGDEATIEFVSQQLRELLATFQCQAQERGQNILAYSAVALGTDQLFVKIALEIGYTCRVGDTLLSLCRDILHY